MAHTMMNVSVPVKMVLVELVNIGLAAGMSLDDAKQGAITCAIKGLTDAGMPADIAFDAVLGEGAYAQLASSIYDRLRA